VEPNKNVRTKWRVKSWDLDGEKMRLKCEMKVRKGTLKELAQDYLDSDTHAGCDVLFVKIPPTLLTEILTGTYASSPVAPFRSHKFSSAFAHASNPIPSK